MFRVEPPPIIRRAYNCIYSIWYLSHRYCYLPLSWRSRNAYFGWYIHPSSGAHTTVSTTSGICHTVTVTCRYRGGVGTHISGGTSTHHQERIQLYLQHLVFVTPLLLHAVIVEESERIFRVVHPPIIRSAYNCIYSIWYLPQRYCYLLLSCRSWNACFGWNLHPSSGAHTTVCTTSGICHKVTAICRYREEVGTHVSGGTYTHHQEHIQLYLQHLVFVTPLLLHAVIVEESERMFRVKLPPIIRSANNCIYSMWYLSHRYCYVPLSWRSRNACFAWNLHPSSGAQTTVSTACGICHTVTATCPYRGGVGMHVSRETSTHHQERKQLYLQHVVFVTPLLLHAVIVEESEHIFRVEPPPIIRSANNCIYSMWYLSHCYCYLPLSWRSWNAAAVNKFHDQTV